MLAGYPDVYPRTTNNCWEPAAYTYVIAADITEGQENWSRLALYISDILCCQCILHPAPVSSENLPRFSFRRFSGGYFGGMSGILSAGGGYRRAVLAVAVTGTVCAGVGLCVYLGLKKIQEKKSLDDDGSGTNAEEETPVTEEQPPVETSDEPEKVSEKPEEPVPEPSVEEKPAPEPVIEEKQADQPSVEEKPIPELTVKEEAPVEPEVPSQPPAKPETPAPAKPTPQPQVASPPKTTSTAEVKAEPAAPTIDTAPPKPKEDIPLQPKAAEAPKIKAPKDVPPQPARIAPVPEKKEEKSETVKPVTEAVKVSAEKAKEKATEIASKVATLASGAVEKTKAAIPSKEAILSSVDNVVDTVKSKPRETLDSVMDKASGDAPSSLSSIETRLDSDIVVIGDTKASSNVAPLSGAEVGAGDTKKEEALISFEKAAEVMSEPAVAVPVAEMLPQPEMPSLNTLSSLGDDIEIIHDSPPSTDTTGTEDSASSGDFVKCERSVDLSQSIEIIKPGEKSDEQKTAPLTIIDEPLKTGTAATSLEDSNANFQTTASTDNSSQKALKTE